MAELGNPNMRASDDERSVVASELGTHFAKGRLDQSEFDQRLRLAMAAKTRGELSGLLTDLPPTPPAPAPAPKMPWWARAVGASERAHVLVTVCIVIAGVALVAHGHPWGNAFIVVMLIMLARLRRRRRYSRWHVHMHEHGLAHTHEGLPAPGMHALVPGHINAAHPAPDETMQGPFPRYGEAPPPRPAQRPTYGPPPASPPPYSPYPPAPPLPEDPPPAT